MKRQPVMPHIAPIAKAAGKSRSVLSSSRRCPNFKVADVDRENGVPKKSDYKIDNVKVLSALHRKMRQII
jgi:hypothetical protein